MDTISFHNADNKIPNYLSIHVKVNRIKSILRSHRQNGEPIVLYINTKTNYYQNIFMFILFNRLLEEVIPEHQGSPQMLLSYDNNRYHLRIETYPDDDVVIYDEQYLEEDQIKEVIEAMLTAETIYDCNEHSIIGY